MKSIILTAFAALSLIAVAAQAAQPATNHGAANASQHSGPYDNTGNGPGETGLEGGGG